MRNSVLKHRATFLLVGGPAWTPRIVHSDSYFNINFPDSDTSFASDRPRISVEAHHHPCPLFAPTRCRTRTILLLLLSEATLLLSEANHFLVALEERVIEREGVRENRHVSFLPTKYTGCFVKNSSRSLVSRNVPKTEKNGKKKHSL